MCVLFFGLVGKNVRKILEKRCDVFVFARGLFFLLKKIIINFPGGPDLYRSDND